MQATILEPEQEADDHMLCSFLMWYKYSHPQSHHHNSCKCDQPRIFRSSGMENLSEQRQPLAKGQRQKASLKEQYSGLLPLLGVHPPVPLGILAMMG